MTEEIKNDGNIHEENLETIEKIEEASKTQSESSKKWNVSFLTDIGRNIIETYQALLFAYPKEEARAILKDMLSRSHLYS